THGDDRGTFLSSVGLNLFKMWVVVKAVFFDVGHIHSGFGGNKVELFEGLLLGLIKVQTAYCIAFVECSDHFFEGTTQANGIFVARARGASMALQGTFGTG